MASVNKVILVGNLGRDPEIRHSASGAAICNLSLATTYVSRDQAGERREETEWHRIVMFGRLAEIAGEYLRKGRAVYIEGRLRTRKWQNREGMDQYTTEVVADQMQMLGGRDSTYDTPRDPYDAPARQQQSAPAAAPRPAAPASGASTSLGDLDDDVPF